MTRRTTAFFIAVGVLCPAALFAQLSSGGSIRGHLADAQGRPLSGAQVVATNPSVTQSPTATTDDHGDFRMTDLEPATYTIRATLAGFADAVREDVAVREGLHLMVNLSLQVEPVRESVTVVTDAPMLEAQRAGSATNVSGPFQRELPLSGFRTWSDFLRITPGVMTTQARFQTYALHGTSHASGVFLVDGADATSALQGSSLYAQFGSDTFSDVQIKTAGMDAAAPLGIGPVVNITTQSGTNQWRGAAGFVSQPRRWNASNVPGGQSLTVETRQADLSLGGPIARDRSWFFVSTRVARNRTGVPRSAQQVGYLQALAPAFTGFDNAWDGTVGFVKVTTRLPHDSQLLASYSRDLITLGGAQPNEAANFRNFTLGGPGYFARIATTWSPSLSTRVSAGYNGKTQREQNLQPNVTGTLVYEDLFSYGDQLIGTGLLGALDASPWPATDFQAHMWTLAADATYYRHSPLGSHELRAGVYSQPQRQNRQITTYNNNGFQLQEVVLRDPANPGAGVVPFHRQVYNSGAITTTHVNSRDHALHVQDTWHTASRLTVTAGLRVDLVKRVDRLFGVTTQRSVEVGPRVGVTFLLSADARNVVRTAWSRVHDNLSVNETQAGTNLSGVVDTYDLAGDGTFATTVVTPPSEGVSRDLVIDLDHYHQAHVDELALGYQRQLPRSTTVEVNLTRRAYRDRPAAVEINGIYEGGVFSGYRDPTQNAIYKLTANTWNWPVVTSLMAHIAHHTGRVTLLAAYTRTWNHLAGTWQPNDPASFIQPGAFANANGIGSVDGCTSGTWCADSDSLAGQPGSGTWRRHIGTLGVSYRGPARFLLSSSYTWQSGPWSGPIVTMLSEPDPAFGPPTVTLANGRIVSNPLATPLRFAYDTRAQGQLQLPALHLWSVRIARGFAIRGRTLEAALDLLNVTNHGAAQAFEFGGNQLFSPFYGEGSLRQFPRAAQVSARVSF